MTVDLRKDPKELRTLLVQRVKTFITQSARSSKPLLVSAIEVGYCFDQSSWILVHFDTRPEHFRDGEWTLFNMKDLFMRPHWQGADDSFSEGKPLSILILADGEQLSKVTEEKFSAALGRMIHDTLVQAKKDGVFDGLPKHKRCQLDIEEFNGSWAWPDFEKLGKSNLI